MFTVELPNSWSGTDSRIAYIISLLLPIKKGLVWTDSDNKVGRLEKNQTEDSSRLQLAHRASASDL